MDLGKVLSRAWDITWRWKLLWVFGFLVSLGQGWSRGSRGFDWMGIPAITLLFLLSLHHLLRLAEEG